MLLGMDGNEANVEKRVGIGEYAFELLTQFSSSKFKVQNSKFIVYLKERPKEDLPKETETWKYRIISPKKLWTQFALPLNLYFARPRPNVFFTPSHYAPRFSPIPTVISIMDLSYVHFPEMFKPSDLYQLKNWTKYSIRKAKKIFTISQASKDDIIETYKISEDKVVVTYPGVKLKAQNSKRKTTVQNLKLLREKYKIEGEYILFVGTLQPRKNIVRLIEAFAMIARGPVAPSSHPMSSVASTPVKQANSAFSLRSLRALDGTPSSRATPRSLSLVIVGKKGWLYEEILQAPKKFGIEDRVKFLDFVPDEDLMLFYQNAICFVLPSLYEGFGLPVLEAMQYGCPVITSNVSSLPEAGGDAVLYVDPTGVNDIANNLKLIINNSELRKKLIEKGYKQVKKFSWEKTARETLKTLEELAKE